MNIAIVGAGLSGATVLKTIIEHKNFTKKFSIDVYETRKRLGVGLAYDSDDEVVMLNVEPDELSLDPKNPNDFVEWLNRNYDKPKNFEGLVSRPRFGNYAEEYFKPYFNHPQVKTIFSEVTDLHPIKQQFKLSTPEGINETVYDAVFLAIGHPDYADYYNLKGQPSYIHNPYPMEKKLSQIPKDAKVGIIGSGATGMDLLRYFNLSHKLDLPLTFYVREDAFYFAHIPSTKESFTFSISDSWIKNNSVEGLIPFNNILNTIKEDLSKDGTDLLDVYNRYPKNEIEIVRDAIQTEDQKLSHVQAYFHKLIGFMPKLYNRLSFIDKELYLSKYYSKMILFKSLTPFLSYKWILELIDTDQVKIVSGLQAITPTTSNNYLISADTQENVDVLINATGFNTSLEWVSENSPLINNLLNKNILLIPDSGKGVLVSWPHTHIINQIYPSNSNIFLFGNLINSTQHENNDAKLIIKEASMSTNWWMNITNSSKT